MPYIELENHLIMCPGLMHDVHFSYNPLISVKGMTNPFGK